MIQDWFKLVRNTINRSGILDEDIWNFDETGFMIGVISPHMVVTGSDRHTRPKEVQPGNREWVTVKNSVCSGVIM